MALNSYRLWLACVLLTLSAVSFGRAQSVLLESATMGDAGRFGGASITTVQYVGWRFEVEQSLQVERIGAHLLSFSDVPGDLFAALVRLPSLSALPQGAPFTTEEVVATTLFRGEFPSSEIFTPMSALLTPGSYALVFGTGQFGATGEGAIHNGFDQDDISPTDISSFIFYGLTGAGLPPVWRTNLASHMRFVIDAHVVNPAGDFDFDDDVDGLDFLIWQRGDSPSSLSASDLADWQENYGASPLAASVAVPEPDSALCVLGLVALFGLSCARIPRSVLKEKAVRFRWNYFLSFAFATLFATSLQARTFELRGVGTLGAEPPTGTVGEGITVTVVLDSDVFQYESVPNPIFHYFVPNTLVPVEIVGSISGTFANVSPIDRFIAVEFGESGDLIALDTSADTTSTSLFSLLTEGVSGFDGDVTPFTTTELFTLFAEAFENDALWYRPSLASAFVGSGDAIMSLENMEWSLIDLDESQPGDFDIDGDVDGRDFLAWQRNPAVGNLSDWQNNYGFGSLTAISVSVPEPGNLVGLLILCCVIAGQHRAARA